MKKEPLHWRISEYLDKDKAARFEELESKGTLYLTQKEGFEHAALMFEIVDQKETLGEYDIPFEGKCRRCGREVGNPVPEVTDPGGRHDIASNEWCSVCNQFAMNILLRWASAYRVKPGTLVDPLRGGCKHAS